MVNAYNYSVLRKTLKLLFNFSRHEEHCFLHTLKCLSIGTPKTINFPFVPNGKLMVLDVPIF